MPDIHDTPAAIAERRRQAAADRARKYRAANREDGKPDARQTDEAISEAVSYLSSVATPDKMAIDIAEIHATAVLVLVREGAKRSYARAAVTARMKPRALHDDICVIPSRRLTPTTRILQPPRVGEWLPPEIDFVRDIIRRWRAVVRPLW